MISGRGVPCGAPSEAKAPRGVLTLRPGAPALGWPEERERSQAIQLSLDTALEDEMRREARRFVHLHSLLI